MPLDRLRVLLVLLLALPGLLLSSGCSGDDETEPPTAGACGNAKVEGGETCDDGNAQALDGCEADCSATPSNLIRCEGEAAALASRPDAPCEVTPGDGSKLFTSIVLEETNILAGGQVLVDAAGKIACVGCDCASAPGAATATRVYCPNAVLSPGLINAHDHITFQSAPYVDTTGERYEHRHDWRVGRDGHTKISNGGTGGNATIRWGELRQVLAGTTSVVGSGGQNGLLRNLDRPSQAQSGGSQEGLGLTPMRYETFPLSDSDGTEVASGCGYPAIDEPSVIPADSAYLPHIAEGIEQSARNEFMCLSGASPEARNLITPRTAIIHGVGLTTRDIRLVASSGSSLIWSPRSNVSLYGNTAEVTTYQRFGVKIALGTDWVRSGSMNMLRELQCADYLNQRLYGRTFSDEALWRMATSNAADALHAGAVIGRIGVGKTADLALFRPRPGSPYRAVIAANPEDVRLTLRGGKPLFGDASLLAGLGAGECDTLDVCGVGKSVCLKGETDETLAELREAAFAQFEKGRMTPYELFYCGAPVNEPVCAPSRDAYSHAAAPDDADADGVSDGNDNCPSIFNPIRPIDGNVQPDTDADGQGDACDVCPLDAGTEQCRTPDSDGDGRTDAEDNCPGTVNPHQEDGDGDGRGDVCDECPAEAVTTTCNDPDGDGDGLPDTRDNCPGAANPNQEDGDGDGKGDACDLCAAPNPGNEGCPVSIYAVKRPVSEGAPSWVGQRVTVENLVVTGVARIVGSQTASQGFFAQLPSGANGYEGPDYSGIYVHAPGHTVSRGDRVRVANALANNYFNQVQLAGNPVITVLASGAAAPAPVAVQPAEVISGGARAAALEGVLVQVSDVSVTNLAPAPGKGDSTPTNEFEITGGLRVNDFFHLLEPMPAAVGATYRSLIGVLELRNENFKLEPRDAADVVPVVR